jgi:hypothetical protein
MPIPEVGGRKQRLTLREANVDDDRVRTSCSGSSSGFCVDCGNDITRRDEIFEHFAERRPAAVRAVYKQRRDDPHHCNVFHYEEATAEARVLSDTARLGPYRLNVINLKKKKKKMGFNFIWENVEVLDSSNPQ